MYKNNLNMVTISNLTEEKVVKLLTDMGYVDDELDRENGEEILEQLLNKIEEKPMFSNNGYDCYFSYGYGGGVIIYKGGEIDTVLYVSEPNCPFIIENVIHLTGWDNAKSFSTTTEKLYENHLR